MHADLTTPHYKFSGQTLDALAEIITGGSANSSKPPIGHYRSQWYLEKFMQEAGHKFVLGGRSRVPATREFLGELSGLQVVALIERAADPREYIQEPETLQAVISHMNLFLEYDGLMLAHERKTVKVRPLASKSAVVEALSEKIIVLNFEAVTSEVNRALKAADSDPPVAVTSACVIIESVCRSILKEMELEPPAKRDVEGLLRAVQEPLGLSPSRSDLAPLIASDVKQVLGGLTTVTKGIGALRTHGGSAHAHEVGQAPIDGRIARFAIHSASTIALFLVETWERKQRHNPDVGVAPQ